jgi:peptide/nickel transport system substrate-binding protein
MPESRSLPIRLAAALLTLTLTACHPSHPDRSTVVFLIESSPTSLDPRIGTDAQSEHIQALLFDGLVTRTPNFTVAPGLAERWDQPDPLTFIFHLRQGIRFSNGKLLTSRDVLWTLNSMRDGTIITAKSGSYASVATIEAPDAATVTIRLKHPDNFLLSNLSTGAIGIVPYGSKRDFWQHPIGSGPFRFVSQEIDKEVVIDRNPFAANAPSSFNAIQRVHFAVVPDATTRALELRKGSADIASNAIPADMLPILAQNPHLAVDSTGGTQVQYLAFNTTDPSLRDPRVRQAIACSINRQLIIQALLGGHARPALSLLPTEHWAYTDQVPHYNYSPVRARTLLDQAGYKPGPNGIRLHLTMKTSTDEGTRLLAATLQQQLAQTGIDLQIRSFETATFLQDLSRGAFQIYGLRWVGGNEQPEIFGYAFSSTRIPPKGANRGRYRNPQLDALLDDASQSADQARRRNDYVHAQQILAEDLPAINLWYQDTVLVHSRRLTHIVVSPSASFDFLRDAELQP